MSGKVDLTTFVTGIMHYVCALDRTGYIGFHRESTSKAKSLIQKKFQKASHAPALHTPSSAPDYNRRHVRWLKPQIFRVLDIFYCKEKKTGRKYFPRPNRGYLFSRSLTTEIRHWLAAKRAQTTDKSLYFQQNLRNGYENRKYCVKLALQRC